MADLLWPLRLRSSGGSSCSWPRRVAWVFLFRGSINGNTPKIDALFHGKSENIIWHMIYDVYHIIWSYKVVPQFVSVQLVPITPISLRFMADITIVFMGFINQLITGTILQTRWLISRKIRKYFLWHMIYYVYNRDKMTYDTDWYMTW